MNDLKQDVNELKEDVDGIKQDVNELKEDVDGIKQDVDEIKENVDINRESLNTLLVWAEDASVEVKVPLFRKAQ